MAKNSGMDGKKQASLKQLIAVGVLLLMLLSVGIWQWTNLSASAPKNTSFQPKPQQNVSLSTASTKPAASPTGMVLPALSPRDPFRSTLVTNTLPPKGGNKVVVRSSSERNPAREISGVPPVMLPTPGGTLQIESSRSEPAEPPTPNWVVVGVVEGPQTIAILKDHEGNRRFVRQGDILEEGWRVHRIERGQVVIKQSRGQISLRVGQSTQEHGGNQ